MFQIAQEAILYYALRHITIIKSVELNKVDM